jgi:hypothetical protein
LALSKSLTNKDVFASLGLVQEHVHLLLRQTLCVQILLGIVSFKPSNRLVALSNLSKFLLLRESCSHRQPTLLGLVVEEVEFTNVIRHVIENEDQDFALVVERQTSFAANKS